MKSLRKISEESAPAFSPERLQTEPPVTVQGGRKFAAENEIFVISGGRYKLFTQSQDYIKIITGNGHIKWSRGETLFSEGDVLLAEEIGEYELYGKCSFSVYRK